MNDDELIIKLSKTWFDDSWDQVLSYRQLFKDKSNYYKYLISNSSKYNLCDIWEYIKLDWKLIQIQLDEIRSNNCRYKICPYCGLISGKLMSHLYNHNVNPLDYLLLYYGLNNLPICPVCNTNPVHYDTSHMLIGKYCSDSCRALDSIRNQISNGTYHLLSENLIRDKNGKSILHTQINKLRSMNGTHPWQHDNLELDKRGCSIMHTKSNISAIENGNHICCQHDIMKSSGELLQIEILRSYGFNVLTNRFRIYNYVSDNAVYYVPDGYIPELDLYIECDGFNLKKTIDPSKYDEYWNQKYKDYDAMGIKYIILRSDSIEIARRELEDKEFVIEYLNSYKD